MLPENPRGVCLGTMRTDARRNIARSSMKRNRNFVLSYRIVSFHLSRLPHELSSGYEKADP